MILVINGKKEEVALEAPHVQELMTYLSVAENRGVAVALNDRVVPKSQWETTSIADGDRVEIISPFEGG